MVNPVADGMNLVSKEGPVLNERNGVLVLSEAAGSHRELRCGALSVKPGDIDGMADALDRALRMPAEERWARATSLRAAIERHTLADWLRQQLKDLNIARYVKALTAI
jgi:trehalose 6-phosphate synthase